MSNIDSSKAGVEFSVKKNLLLQIHNDHLIGRFIVGNGIHSLLKIHQTINSTYHLQRVLSPKRKKDKKVRKGKGNQQKEKKIIGQLTLCINNNT